MQIAQRFSQSEVAQPFRAADRAGLKPCTTLMKSGIGARQALLRRARNEASPQTAESKPARFARESSLLGGRSAAAKTASKAGLAKLASFREITALEDV